MKSETLRCPLFPPGQASQADCCGGLYPLSASLRADNPWSNGRSSCAKLGRVPVVSDVSADLDADHGRRDRSAGPSGGDPKHRQAAQEKDRQLVILLVLLYNLRAIFRNTFLCSSISYSFYIYTNLYKLSTFTK